ncbi:MAG: type II toxin-antitoxin system prevent-host-death family antitoxin [Actinomycetota bacterium]|nr:type II toxin-antitoxin system prevent-host-death family antitoxin [Actinomycetota bacterium]
MAGRPSARLVGVTPRAWRRWDEIGDLFSGPSDDAWESDRDHIDQQLVDRWSGR